MSGIPIDDTYQKFVDAKRHLPLRACDGHLITRLFGAGKHNLAVPFLFEIFDVGEAGKELAVVEAIDLDDLGGELGVLCPQC